MTSSVQNLQSNVARLEDVIVGTEVVKDSLNAQLAQDQEAFVAAITARFQQTMQDSLAASEARQNAIIDGLRAENSFLKRKIEVLETTIEEKLSATKVELEARIATKVDQSTYARHWHRGGNESSRPNGCW